MCPGIAPQTFPVSGFASETQSITRTSISMVSRPAILGRQRQTRGNKAARLRRCPRAQRESGRLVFETTPRPARGWTGSPGTRSLVTGRATPPPGGASSRDPPWRTLPCRHRCRGPLTRDATPGALGLERCPAGAGEREAPADAWAAIRRASEAVFAPGAPFLAYLGPKRLCSSDGDRTCHSPCPLTDLDIRAQLCRV